MATTRLTPARIAYAVVALVAFTGLGIEYAIVLSHTGEVAMRTVRYFSFFTILTNGLVAFASLGLAMGSGRLHRWASRPGTRAAISVHILVVAIIFHLLLSNLIHPSVLGHWGNMVIHQLVPALWVAAWLGFPSHGGLDRRAPLRWLAYPLLYGLWTLVHGAASGWYPYPFMDVAKWGLPVVLRNMLLIGLFFAGLGFVIRWIDGRLARWRAAREESAA